MRREGASGAGKRRQKEWRVRVRYNYFGDSALVVSRTAGGTSKKKACVGGLSSSGGALAVLLGGDDKYM